MRENIKLICDYIVICTCILCLTYLCSTCTITTTDKDCVEKTITGIEKE